VTVVVFDAGIPAITIERREVEETVPVPLAVVEQLAEIVGGLEERIAALEVGSRAAAVRAVLDAFAMA
jgi:hypothetical protein